jgi:hypothetical protein
LRCHIPSNSTFVFENALTFLSLEADVHAELVTGFDRFTKKYLSYLKVKQLNFLRIEQKL